VSRPGTNFAEGVGGVPIAYTIDGVDSDAPTVVMVHATGFCKELWLPLVDQLAARGCRFRSLLIDQRAHGESGRPQHPFDWWDLGDDVLRVLSGSSGLTGVGHSAGGTGLIMAELEAPGTFTDLLLVEPIIFPAPYRRVEHPLAARARRRQRTFRTRSEALEHFGRGSLFSSWYPGMLDLFVEHCVGEEGDHLALRCHPDDEAEFYDSARLSRVWERLGELDLPVTVMAGAQSSSHPPDVVARQASRIPNGRVVMIEDATHLVPMERPDVVADWLEPRLTDSSSQDEPG